MRFKTRPCAYGFYKRGGLDYVGSGANCSRRLSQQIPKFRPGRIVVKYVSTREQARQLEKSWCRRASPKKNLRCG